MRWSVNLSAVRLVDGLGAVLWRPRCLLCRDPGHAGLDLCLACYSSLPWNHNACHGCALPLPPLPDQAQTFVVGLPAATTFPITVPTPEPRCGVCLRKPPPVACVYAAFIYRWPLDRLLPRLKFHQDMAAGRLLAQLSAAALAAAPQPQALIPIPLHHSRLRKRGYDQTLELAQPIARELNLPLRNDLLRRTRATHPQSQLDAAARRRNVRGAFTAYMRGAMPTHVALFDDVMTTGATLHAAAIALQRAGIARVDAWTCARALSPNLPQHVTP